METDLLALIPQYGYFVVFGIVALESAGLPLPGETVLISAAMYSGAGGSLRVELIKVIASGAVILGDNLSFWIERKCGRDVLKKYGRPQHRLYKQD
jgi:membrane protein DedA with SNARE-associated domain